MAVYIYFIRLGLTTFLHQESVHISCEGNCMIITVFGVILTLVISISLCAHD